MIIPASYLERKPIPAALLEDPKRVAVEPKIARWAIENDLPTLAVCMGVQTLALLSGGRLIQDIPSWFADADAQNSETSAEVIHRIGEGEKPRVPQYPDRSREPVV